MIYVCLIFSENPPKLHILFQMDSPYIRIDTQTSAEGGHRSWIMTLMPTLGHLDVESKTTPMEVVIFTPCITGWWFGTFFHNNYMGIILPIDFHIFQRGRYTTNQIIWLYKQLFVVIYLYIIVYIYICSRWCDGYKELDRMPTNAIPRLAYVCQRRLCLQTLFFLMGEPQVAIICYPKLAVFNRKNTIGLRIPH